MTSSIKFNGKEVRNPALRVLLATVLVILGILTFLLMAVFLVLAFVISLPVRVFSPRLANKICKITVRR